MRLRPLVNPMKMNGCAMVLLNVGEGARAAAGDVAEWLANTLGEAGAVGRVWRP